MKCEEAAVQAAPAVLRALTAARTTSWPRFDRETLNENRPVREARV
jgi:hypothetical protein